MYLLEQFKKSFYNCLFLKIEGDFGKGYDLDTKQNLESNYLLDALSIDSDGGPNISKEEWKKIKENKGTIKLGLNNFRKQNFLKMEKLLDDYFSEKEEIYQLTKKSLKEMKALYGKTEKTYDQYDSSAFPKTFEAIKKLNFNLDDLSDIFKSLELTSNYNRRNIRYLARVDGISKEYVLKKIFDFTKNDNFRDNWPSETVGLFLSKFNFKESDNDILDTIVGLKGKQSSILGSLLKAIDFTMSREDLINIINKIKGLDDSNIGIVDGYFSSNRNGKIDKKKIIDIFNFTSNMEGELNSKDNETIYDIIYQYSKYFKLTIDDIKTILSIKIPNNKEKNILIRHGLELILGNYNLSKQEAFKVLNTITDKNEDELLKINKGELSKEGNLIETEKFNISKYV